MADLHDYPDDLNVSGLFDYWRLLVQRKFLILGVTLLGTVLGFFSTIGQPFVFRSNTTLEIQSFNENFMGLGQLDPQAPNYSPTQLNIETQLRILQSDSLKSRVLEKLNRDLVPSPPPAFSDLLARVRQMVQDLLGETPQDPLAALRQALGWASSTLQINYVNGTRLIEIRCESTVPEVAAGFANAIANEYMEQTLEARMTGLQRTSQWFSTQLETLRTKLEESEALLRRANQAAGPTVSQQDALITAKLMSLQQELSGVQAEHIRKEAQYQMLLAGLDDPRSSAFDSQNLSQNRAKLEDLQKTLADLSKTYTSAHYRIKQTQKQIAEAEAALKRERQDIIERIRADLEATQKREKLLTAAYNQQTRNLVAGNSSRTLDVSLLQREVDINRQLYSMMLQQLTHVGVAAAVPSNNIRVIDPAVPSRSPSNLNQTRNTLLGLAAGLLFGFAIVVVLHNLDQTVRAPGHLSSLVDAPELGVIPSLAVEKSIPASLMPAPSGAESVLPLARVKTVEPDAVELVTSQDATSLLADSFRATLASILIPNESNGHRPRLVVITSPNLKEGKSTIVSNLAIALVELRRRVLLIDADLRQPRLHKIFKLDNDAGLSDLIKDDKPIDEYPLDVLARTTGIANLFLLPSGRVSSGKINSLLFSSRLNLLLTRLSNEFDMVLVDTPPMLQFVDARVVSRLSDGVILVFRSGSSARDSAIGAYQRLTGDGTTIIGTILNDWVPTAAEGKHYRLYRDYYQRKS